MNAVTLATLPVNKHAATLMGATHARVVLDTESVQLIHPNVKVTTLIKYKEQIVLMETKIVVGSTRLCIVYT